MSRSRSYCIRCFFEQEHEHELGTGELLRKPAGMRVSDRVGRASHPLHAEFVLRTATDRYLASRICNVTMLIMCHSNKKFIAQEHKAVNRLHYIYELRL